MKDVVVSVLAVLLICYALCVLCFAITACFIVLFNALCTFVVPLCNLALVLGCVCLRAKNTH